MDGNATAGVSALLVTYAFALDWDIYAFFINLVAFERSLVSFERCLYFTTIKGERSQITDPDTQGFSNNWPERGEIAFDNYWSKYRPGLNCVIRGLTVDIRAGEKIGVVGRTGAGKSSLILCLLRVLESYKGRIIIDGIDISKIGLHDLRRRVTVIPQDAYLFTGTLRDNMDPLEKYTNEQIENALRKVGLGGLLDLRGGLTMPIAENGDNLSVGEKQLITIARAILKHSKIILLDEATSSIDIVTESLIQEALAACFEKATVVTIAHRINTILKSDRILVLSQGKILEYDTPSNLLSNKSSSFARMWREASKQKLE
eukprot:TRINITY_DN12975_c0_g1_i4.p1 TRINITY_DN12975_c0_g1~~TRINITY_DN12975_c0_g1_i4.p1  ORF type:complete len:317 (+),score=44.49 TRINITY_DN12975_c0_g1_i4:626-1576(+)